MSSRGVAPAGAMRWSWRPRTFRLRLTLAMSLLALIVLGFASVTIYLAARVILRRNLDSALLAIARTEVASALDGPTGQVHVHEEGWASLHISIPDAYVKHAMIKRGGSVVARTANLGSGAPLMSDPEKEARALDGVPTFGTLYRADEAYRGIYYPLQDADGGRLVGIVAVPLEPIRHSLDNLLEVLMAVLLVGSGASAWAASRLARRFTRPLEGIAEASHAIGESDLSARIPETSPDDELRDLTAILNDMLARLQSSIESQRRFVADASHELRSPLTNLRGAVEVALRQPRSEADYRTTLGEALAEIERLCRLVDDLLTLSRADARQVFLHREPCDLAEIAAAAARAHAGRAAALDVTIASDLTEWVTLHGDVDRLRAVLDNLLDNALHHSPHGSTVRLRVRRLGHHGIVEVHDAGPGLDSEDQARVFERFYRTDGARARRHGGLGLGLAIAKSIVDAHGGRIGVSSAPGRGATFTVELPLSVPGESSSPA